MTTDSGHRRLVTDRDLKTWLAKGAVDRGVGDGLTFLASKTAAKEGKASWILRFRINGRPREKVLGRYPALSLKDAREKARLDKVHIANGIDVAAAKQADIGLAMEVPTMKHLGEAWFARYIAPRYKHPDVVERVLRLHINPVLGDMPPRQVKPVHIDHVLTRTVAAGAPTVANDALLYMSRMFKMALRNHWVESDPAAAFGIEDAGGTETPGSRWLTIEELQLLAKAMRETPSFGRQNELSMWLLLALCVRKMELLSAQWKDFDLISGVWTLKRESTKTQSELLIPLAPAVIDWLREVRVVAGGRPYVFPARRLVSRPKGNRFPHVSPDTLNVALKCLRSLNIEHFTVHDMRRTARSNLSKLGINRFVAERSLNHKLRSVEGIYDRYDYFAERTSALATWAALLARVEKGEDVAMALEGAKSESHRFCRPPCPLPGAAMA